MLERTVIAHRMICGESNLLTDGNSQDLSKIDVTISMMNSCKAAGMKYDMYMKQQREEMQKTNIEKEKQLIIEEIWAERHRQEKWKTLYEKLCKESDKLACRPERESKMSLLIESNSTRKRSAEYMENLVSSRNKVQKLQEKLKKIPLN